MSDRKILLAEDIIEHLEVMRFILERDGWAVVTVSDGKYVLETAIVEQPTVIVMDYNMPKVNGIEACLHVKQHPATSHVPVILYTALPAIAIRQKALEAGAHGFMNKPFLPDDLRQHANRAYNLKK